MKLVAIDPGKNEVGVAVFDDQGQLQFADVIRPQPLAHVTQLVLGDIPVHEAMLSSAVAWAVQRAILPILNSEWIHFISEWPEHYADAKLVGRSRVKASDLFWLSACAGAVSASLPCATVRYFFPKEWKSNVPDTVCWKRIENALAASLPYRAAEHPVIQHLRNRHGANSHHAIEAAGIGLFAMKKLKKGMVT